MPSLGAKLINLAFILLQYKRRGPRRWAGPRRSRRSFEPPWHLGRKFRLERLEVMGRRVITMHPKTTSGNKHLLFFHGGAYANEISVLHWLFVGKLVEQTQCKCTLIEYPLTPEHDHRKTFAVVKAAHQQLATHHPEPMVFAGDSAGGGLALAFAQLLLREDVHPQPVRLALISPWVDIQTAPDLPAALKQKDLILNTEALNIAGRNYTGPADPRHFLVSPLYGDLQGLCPIAIWAGTNEVFHPDILRLTERLLKAGVPFRYFEGAGMQHDYPLFPIPEGREALRQIVDFIHEDDTA